jgi:enterochelin esterase-like enzyme
MDEIKTHLMRKFFLFIMAVLFVTNIAIAQETKTSTIVVSPQIPKVTLGSIRHYENFESKYFSPHNIDVWLPEDYNTKNKYAVLYMHDGKSLFDTTITWNKQEWGVEEMMTQLLKEGKIKNTIVVGIWNGDKKRHAEYFPQKAFESFNKQLQDSMYKIKRNEGLLFNAKVNSDSYLKFLVKELKPFIDRNFSTLKDRDNTFIAGSSMGGLISLYAMCEYPKVFGGAACLSTHWPGVIPAKNNPVPAAFIKYLEKNAVFPQGHKLYFDYGSISLDYYYKPYQIEVDKLFTSKGFNAENYLSKEFVGDGHAEIYWKKRLDIPLLFLLKK